jgi:hypothetical protein
VVSFGLSIVGIRFAAKCWLQYKLADYSGSFTENLLNTKKALQLLNRCNAFSFLLS